MNTRDKGLFPYGTHMRMPEIARRARSKERRLAEPNKRRATPPCGRFRAFPWNEFFNLGLPRERPLAALCSLAI
ncbi:hypothetical protein, partial [Burkholderia ubonensis]|uniref:hypothetical protein n=1 Tax=Burkholderia ubonensis TaxID=101571 RepID=UPI001E2F99CE